MSLGHSHILTSQLLIHTIMLHSSPLYRYAPFTPILPHYSTHSPRHVSPEALRRHLEPLGVPICEVDAGSEGGQQAGAAEAQATCRP